MRLLAEERRLRTLELLLTAPVTEAQVVIAKYLASMTLVALMVGAVGQLCRGARPVRRAQLGADLRGYLGLLLLASALVSLGLLASSLTANQLVAALLSLGLFMLLWVIDDFGWLLPEPFDALFVNLSLSAHFVPFAIGSLYLSDAGFFLSLTLLGLFLSVRALGRR